MSPAGELRRKGRSRRLFDAHHGSSDEPPQKHSKFKALQRAKTLSSKRISGPPNVLAVEVFGRAWTPAISSSGVAIQVNRLRQRALVTR
jgi:hypothetical protein